MITRPSVLLLFNALFAGALAGFALSFTDSSWGLVGALAPLFLAISLSSGSSRVNIINSGCYGFCGWALSAWWLASGISAMNQTYWWAGLLGVTSLSALSTLPYFTFGALCLPYALFSNSRPRPFLASALLTLLVELWPAKFPGSLANALSSATPLIQIADWGGVPAIHFALYAFGFSLVGLVKNSGSLLNKWVPPLTSILMLGFLLLYGTTRLTQWHERLIQIEPIRIASIQPNLPITGAVKNYGKPGSLESLLTQTTQILQTNPPPDLIVWPEIPIYFSPFNSPHDQERINSLLTGHKTPLLLNADMFSNETINGRVPFYNAEQLFQGNGQVMEEYRKMILVPLGEYLPFEEFLSGPRFERILSGLRRYVPGKEVSLFHLSPKLLIGTPVCLEALHSDHIATMVHRGANVLINPSNDGYFGASSGARLNMTFSIFRAIEFRIPIVRVTNSGISVVINQLGQIVPGSKMDQFQADQTTISVHPKQDILGVLDPRSRGTGALALFALLCIVFRRKLAVNE